MAKIVFIDPRGWQGAVSGYRPSPNIGIAYLIPMIRRNGHEILVIDLNNDTLSDEEALNIIEEYKPDIVGLSIKFATVKNARNLAQKIKGILPKINIILGGPHATLSWRELITEHWVDIVFRGEGEQVLPNICSSLIERKSIEDLPGVITKQNFKNNFCLNFPLISVSDLNILPYPEYDLFPKNVRDALCTQYPLVTSRGCVYNCIYCCVPIISNKKFRPRAPENIIEELKWAHKIYNVMTFEIIDDVFNLDITRCKEICNTLINADLRMTWCCPNGLRADRVDKELAELMFNSGCRSVMIGIESADPKVFNSVKKGETIEDIERGINIFKEVGIRVGGYFIIGLPGDSFKSQKKSVKFAKKMGIDAHFNMLVPYFGTELWEWAKANAHFLHDVEDALHFADTSKKVCPIIETDDFNASDRQKAYEMVHTSLGRFDMLIPHNLSHWQYYSKIFKLLWKYDKKQLLNFMYMFFKNMLRIVKKYLTRYLVNNK